MEKKAAARNEEDDDEMFFRVNRFSRIFVLSIIFVVVSVGGVWYYVASEQICEWSKFNVLSVLFSGLAFIMMIEAILLQRRELSLQRKELVETRNVLEETAKANRDSADIASKQMKLQVKLAELSLELKGFEVAHVAKYAAIDGKKLDALRGIVKDAGEIAK